MTRWTWITTALAALALAAGGAAPLILPVGAQPKPVVWNLPHVAAPTYYHTLNLNALAAKLKEKSQGGMETRVHPAPSLYPSHELSPAGIEGGGELAPARAADAAAVLL